MHYTIQVPHCSHFFDILKVSLLVQVSPPTPFCSFFTEQRNAKIHQHFRLFSSPEHKKRASEQPIDRSEARFCLIFPVFLPKMRKETPFAVVDKNVSFWHWTQCLIQGAFSLERVHLKAFL